MSLSSRSGGCAHRRGGGDRHTAVRRMSARGQPAVGDQGLPGDERRLVGREVRNGRRDLLLFPPPHASCAPGRRSSRPRSPHEFSRRRWPQGRVRIRRSTVRRRTARSRCPSGVVLSCPGAALSVGSPRTCCSDGGARPRNGEVAGGPARARHQSAIRIVPADRRKHRPENGSGPVEQQPPGGLGGGPTVGGARAEPKRRSEESNSCGLGLSPFLALPHRPTTATRYRLPRGTGCVLPRGLLHDHPRRS